MHAYTISLSLSLTRTRTHTLSLAALCVRSRVCVCENWYEGVAQSLRQAQERDERIAQELLQKEEEERAQQRLVTTVLDVLACCIGDGVVDALGEK
mgnify:CR=1 FL=1